ncbi:MAG: M3 family metallopeptidase [Propionibacteriaceae bacterium]|jgi:peptidyl-dipeptidase Dcp|nr:M3 family metallopeptidase [Propionibacteriaceae bacterium]
MGSSLALLFGVGSDALFRPADFSALTDDDYLAAFHEAMAVQRDGLKALAADAAPPTAGLLRDWEEAGWYLDRVAAAFMTLKDADTNARRDAIEAETAPLLARHHDAIFLDPALYARLRALDTAATRGDVTLDAEQAWFLAELLRRFRRAGADLDQAARDRLQALNAEIATLEAQFSSLVPAVRTAAAVTVTDRQALDGLSDDQIEAAAQAARERGVDGWVLELVNTTQQPVLAHLNDRATRRLVFAASTGRGQGQGPDGAAHDVRPLILALARRRDEKARLLGFDHFAAYTADDGCVKTTAAVMALLGRVAAAALRNARREAADLQQDLAAIEPGATLEAWDWQWLAERRRAATLALDDAQLAPYLEFQRVLTDGVFAAATGLYGITFQPRDDIPGYTPDTLAFEVRDADGQPLGLVLFDPYARPTKQGGAWMTDLVPQSRLFGDRPVVTNNCNQSRPGPGKPSLMTWDQVVTLFHEFGHDLHGLLSDVAYPSLAGTNTPRDFVEYPSQVNEIWAWDPALIARYARHWETGQPLPPEWVDRLAASRHEGEGFAAAEIYQAMLLDQAWHTAPADRLPQDPDGVDAFERHALEAHGVYYPLVPPRYRSCYFSHIWGGGYAAGYYSYLFSEVLDADTAAWFEEHGGLSRANGDAFRRGILAKGGSVDVLGAFREFRGRDMDPVYLLRRRGLE